MKNERYILPINKIAKIKTKDLPIKHREGEPEEHYVFVRDYNKKKGTYTVNVCTHLEKYDKQKKKYVNSDKHLQQVKYGNTYPVPIRAANFPVWTGIKREVYEVPKGKMFEFEKIKFNKPHTKEKHDKFFDI